jgi:5'-deoxy-5'-methylthioadenosine phosphorylase
MWWLPKMSEIAILGGSAMPNLRDLNVIREEEVSTPFGAPSALLRIGKFGGKEIIFLDRHGFSLQSGYLPPHRINYRANLFALYQAGVKKIIGVSIVGGIRSDMTPGHFVFPDQLIDYTHDRPSTFFEDHFERVHHTDFTYPYCPQLRELFIRSSQQLNLSYSDDATYGVTQGPRFETIAEINRLERDGCDIVGMTAMPEALLARELNMSYASIAVVGDKAAGRSDGLRNRMEEIKDVVDASMEKMRELLKLIVSQL